MGRKQLAYSITLAIAVTGSHAALAKDDLAYQLSPLDVIANPVIEENHLDLFSSISSVVTEDQLRDQNAVDLASALRRTPGVQITRFNPVGTFSGDGGDGVFIRGMGTSRPGSEIKTYVDGVPLYMGVWGHPVLDMLPINGMESITVYKGPQPQINGNNFSSINLSTKRAVEDGLHGSVSVSGGIYGTIIEKADIAGKYGDLDFSLAQGYATSDGHRDNADGELKNVMGSLNYQLNTNWSVGASFIYSNNSAKDPGNSNAPNSFNPEYTSEAGVVSINLSHEYENVKGHLKLYTTQGEGNWYDHPNNPSQGDFTPTDTLSSFETYGLRWQEQVMPWDGGTITIGVDSDWLMGEVEDNVGLASSQGNYETPTFRLTSPYLSITQVFDLNDTWSIVPSAGIRYYNHSEFEEQISPHAGISLVSEKLTFYANISRGINYPGLEIATLSKFISGSDSSSIWGNAAPEQVEHGEIGFKATPFESTQIDVSFFNDRIKNRYVFEFNPGLQFVNFGKYTMRGFEVSIQQGITDDWSVFGGLTMLDPSINDLPYVPKTAVTGGINGKISKVNLAIDAQYQSETMTFNNASRKKGVGSGNSVSSLIVLNARAGYPIPELGEKGEVFISGENLLDRDYEYRPGYKMPGIWGQIGISASF